METPLYRLGTLIAFVLFMPAVAYVVGIVWMTVVGMRQIERTWRMICVLLPIPFFGMIAGVRPDMVREAWEQSPVLASILFVISGIGVPCVLIPIAVKLWRLP